MPNTLISPTFSWDCPFNLITQYHVTNHLNTFSYIAALYKKNIKNLEEIVIFIVLKKYA
jgi:hypothetical protein